ncbi:MAG: RidA family protein [Gammaproteobacteria bacterium]|nr:RidA family protein [Gammaproteobacteria bacterium]
MRRVIKTGLTKPAAPHEWAVAANGVLYSVHVPIRPDGTIETGNSKAQADITFADLEATLKAAGGNISDVVFVQIYLTSLDHKPAVDEVYKHYFTEPYPVRACIAVSALPTPGTVIEVVATASLQA